MAIDSVAPPLEKQAAPDYRSWAVALRSRRDAASALLGEFYSTRTIIEDPGTASPGRRDDPED